MISLLIFFGQVGHAGTLDPLSTGLLIVCVGKATKLADRLDMLLTLISSSTAHSNCWSPSINR